jgi:general secretion pathway protein G
MLDAWNSEPGMMRIKKERDQGFSLMELLVALVILALIVGLVAPQVLGYLGKAKSQTAEVQIKNLQTSLSLYLVDMGSYPSASDGLDALVKSPAGSSKWRGPYVDGDKVPLDPWEHPYRYEPSSTGGKPRIFSLGADDAPGGEGDNADVG